MRLGQHHINDVGDRLLNIGIVRNRADDGGFGGTARCNAAGNKFSGVDQQAGADALFKTVLFEIVYSKNFESEFGDHFLQ